MKFKFILLLTLVFTSSILSAKTVTLKKHTSLSVRLSQNINGNLNHQGETIYFEVLDDILVENEIVINKGAFVKGRISDAESRKSMGKAGKLTIEARSVNAVDGQMVDIVRDAMSNEGRKRTGATVAHVIMWGPLGLLAKGRAARIMLDTEFDIEVESDIKIDTNNQIENSNKLDNNGLEVTFKKYKGKINYAKGKQGNDFNLNISVPEATNLSNQNVSIVEVQGHKLHLPVRPVSIEWDSKNKSFLAVFPFIEMVKYISPGSSNVKVMIETNDSTMIGETVITTKWKLK